MFEQPYFEPSDETEELDVAAPRRQIKIAFFKGSPKVWFHRFIRWWTKSIYSHVELLLDEETWVSISPALLSTVTTRIVTSYEPDDWDFLEFGVSDVQHHAMKEFIAEITGDGYDWLGMLLSQVLPFIIKSRNKWYCSSFIAHCLVSSGLIKPRRLGIYGISDLSPGRLYNILHDIIAS